MKLSSTVPRKLSYYGSHTATVVPRREKIGREWDLCIIFVHYSGLQMSPKTKKSNEPFLRKSDFKFLTYLMMARNSSKSLREVCERGLGLTNDTNNFSSPYPL